MVPWPQHSNKGCWIKSFLRIVAAGSVLTCTCQQPQQCSRVHPHWLGQGTSRSGAVTFLWAFMLAAAACGGSSMLMGFPALYSPLHHQQLWQGQGAGGDRAADIHVHVCTSGSGGARGCRVASISAHQHCGSSITRCLHISEWGGWYDVPPPAAVM